MYGNADIQEMPLGVPLFRRKVSDFLEANGLRLEEVDLYLAVLSPDGGILAGGGLRRDVLKCLAVNEEFRSEGLMTPLVSRLVSEASQRGFNSLKVFTKPAYRAVFESLGFRLIGSAPKAVLMENGRGLEEYCAYLSALRRDGTAGVIVMNANPFTLGHQYLVNQASLRTDRLVVIPVWEDSSEFSYAERLEMIREGCGTLAEVAEGSAYQISAATFPTYFLKDLSDASETQMRLDIDVFGRHIAPALGATVRFVGSEPSDPLTARYNRLMKEMLPSYGIRVEVVPRLKSANGRFVSASRVRKLLSQGRFRAAAPLTPSSSYPYLRAYLAGRALRTELDAPLKPGLVGPDSNGAHSDMDYALMSRSISAIRPYFPKMAVAASAEELRRLGIEAEDAMMHSTCGVNAHRGAIFALGIALRACSVLSDAGRQPAEDRIILHSACRKIASRILHGPSEDGSPQGGVPSHGADAVSKYGVKGAREMAEDGYRELFTFWLPYYSSIKKQPYALQRTLVYLIAALDDTCIIHRAGLERSEQLRDEAADIFGRIAHDAAPEDIQRILEDMCRQYSSEGVSPGGCADMLTLIIFVDSILTK